MCPTVSLICTYLLTYISDNLKSLEQDLEGTKNLILEMNQIRNVLENMTTEDQENNPNSGNKSESVASIDNKIRSTRKVYKELKNFLGEFLDRMDSDQNLGPILQTLWNKFQDRRENRYVQISHLVNT